MRVDEVPGTTAAMSDGPGLVVAPPSAQGLRPGDGVGRYVIVEKVGEGGMGAVYRAQDPALDRDVAIKIVRADRSDAFARARLQREARSLAQLGHPNVVALYDVLEVEAGTCLAMEFVPGQTLAEWIRVRRSLDEILTAYVAAGRGLAAAHRRGLVHRDFKPANVLVGRDDGRIRVADFGVARTAGGIVDPSLAATFSVSPAGSMTATGAMVGTPAYMAPEQILGAEVDSRSDQYAFAVALHEALTGRLPDGGDTRSALLASFGLVHAEVDGGPREAVPPWLRAILERALSPAPTHRFPDMDAMLAAIERGTGRRRRRLVWTAAAGTLVLLGTALALAAGRAPPEPCTGLDAPVARVWGADRRARVARRFGQAGQPGATLARVTERVDDWTAGWTKARQEACAATRVRGEQSEALLDRRMACLDRRLGELDRSLVLVESEVGVERGVNIVAGLTSPDVCASAESLDQVLPPPSDPAAQAQVAALQQTLADAKARFDAGDYPGGIAILEPALARAEALGYAPLTAEAYFLYGRLCHQHDRYVDATAAYQRAAMEAEVARDDRLRFRALTYEADVRGYFLSQRAESLLLEKQARALLTRVGGDPELRAELDERMANVEFNDGDLDRSRTLMLGVLAVRRERSGDDDLVMGRTLRNVGRVFENRKEHAEALRYYEEAERRYVRALGPDHSELSFIWHNVANALRDSGQLRRAVEFHRKCLALLERRDGAAGDKTGRTLSNFGVTLRALGELDESRAVLERSLAIKLAREGEKAKWTQDTRVLLAETYLALGLVKEALVELEKADSASPAPWTSALLGHAEVRRGRVRAGLARLDAAVDATRDAPGHQRRAVLHERGAALLRVGRHADARRDLEAALALCVDGSTPPQNRADIELDLARALDGEGEEPERALDLARTGLDRLARMDAQERRRAEVQHWIDARTRGARP